MMVKLALLLTHKHRLISIAAILDVFSTVNYMQQEPAFSIELVVPEDEEQVLIPNYEHYTYVRLADAAKPNLVLIPAFVPENVTSPLSWSAATP